MTLEKKFNFIEEENIIYDKWYKSNCFKPTKNSETAIFDLFAEM